MTDLMDRLDRLVDAQHFAPLPAQPALDRGRRALRRRRAVVAVGTAAAVVVGALFVGTAVRYVSQPDLEFGDPAGRRPADSGVPTERAYADLVTSRTGDDSVSITGFGWPLAEMDPDDISQLDAESMCLPMLESAAPEVPATAWRHDESWVDSFPSRATLPTMFEAEHDGRWYSATCALPGSHVPELRPDLERLPSASDELGISRQCAYLGHLDLTEWDVVAAHDARAAGEVSAVVAALRSPDGRLATCVLSRGPAGRSVQLTADPRPLAPDDGLVFHRSGRSILAAGRAPARAAGVELRVADRTEYAGVVDSTFADRAPPAPVVATGPSASPSTDADGNELASYSTTTPGESGALLPADCFYSLETGNDGC